MNEAKARTFVDTLAQAGERRHPVAIPADFDQRCTPAAGAGAAPMARERVLQRRGGNVMPVRCVAAVGRPV